MTTGKAESVQLRSAPEATLAVAPSTGWVTVQPDQAGVTEFYLKTSTVTPEPMTVLRQKEAPELVDADAAPKFTGDLTLDHLYAWREGMMLSVVKHNGGTGQSRFFPTSRTTTEYVVAANGALQSGTIVSAKGFANAANNGTFIVGSSSTGTQIKVSGGVAETVTPSGSAVVEVAGFRGATGDIQMSAAGNITSTVADFTTMGLQVGQVIYVGGAPGTAFSFASGYIGFVQITAITATQLTTNPAVRQWTQGAADNGSGKTIELRWNSWIREVAMDSVDYLEQSYHLELAIPGIGAANATAYCYGQGMVPNDFDITAAAKALIKFDLMFSGNFVTNPTTSRVTGPSTAMATLERQRFNGVTKERYLRFTNAASGAIVANKVQSWKLSHKNGVTPLKQQGTYGTAENIVGKAEVMVDAELYVNQTEGIAAAPDNTTLTFGAGFNNGDGGVFFLVPSLKFTEAATTFPANGPVMLSAKSAGFRDAIGNYTLGISMFADLPTT